MRVLASSVLGMEIFVIGFAILLAKDTGSTGIWIGAIIALLLIYTTSQMKKKKRLGFRINLAICFNRIWIFRWCDVSNGRTFRSALDKCRSGRAQG